MCWYLSISLSLNLSAVRWCRRSCVEQVITRLGCHILRPDSRLWSEDTVVVSFVSWFELFLLAGWQVYGFISSKSRTQMQFPFRILSLSVAEILSLVARQGPSKLKCDLSPCMMRAKHIICYLMHALKHDALEPNGANQNEGIAIRVLSVTNSARDKKSCLKTVLGQAPESTRWQSSVDCRRYLILVQPTALLLEMAQMARWRAWSSCEGSPTCTFLTHLLESTSEALNPCPNCLGLVSIPKWSREHQRNKLAASIKISFQRQC